MNQVISFRSSGILTRLTWRHSSLAVKHFRHTADMVVNMSADSRTVVPRTRLGTRFSSQSVVPNLADTRLCHGWGSVCSRSPYYPTIYPLQKYRSIKVSGKQERKLTRFQTKRLSFGIEVTFCGLKLAGDKFNFLTTEVLTLSVDEFLYIFNGWVGRYIGKRNN